MIKIFLSILLHHANRQSKAKDFYSIKDRLLNKYGTIVGYDLQFIEGKECYTCGGTGVFKGFDWCTRRGWRDTCYNCGGSGFYKQHQYIILKRIRFGNYLFHLPMHRYYTKKTVEGLKPHINGYVDHAHSKFGESALIILFLLYSPAYLFHSDIGIGWYTYWYYPQNWAGTILRIGKRMQRAKLLMEKL